MDDFTKEQIADALEKAISLLPAEIPPEMALAHRRLNEITDFDWPLVTNQQVLHYLLAWRLLNGYKPSYAREAHSCTHGHAGQQNELNLLGYNKLYTEGVYTKYVSIGWHCAGRFEYDKDLINELPKLPLGAKLLDFGAAPWIQSIFYAQKGLKVTAVNKSLESDCNRFGRFLATVKGVRDRIQDIPSDEVFHLSPASLDVVYAIDVFEHILPLVNGEPGWIPFAEALLKALKPGGIWYVNAPMGKDVTCHPAYDHPQHFTSLITLEEWNEQHNLKAETHFLYRKPL